MVIINKKGVVKIIQIGPITIVAVSTHPLYYNTQFQLTAQFCFIQKEAEKISPLGNTKKAVISQWL